jgi:cytochrome b6
LKKLLRRLEPERLGIAVAAWFRERIDAGPLLRLLDRKTVPTHRHSWIYVLGGAAAFVFALQVASGSLLMLYYQPTEAAAHESVRKIATEVPSGWLIRSVHAWGADLFIALVALHFAVKLFVRAYRQPRELTWFTGMLLLALALAAGFSGYLLPWTELSYYATLVGTQIPGTVPLVGDWIVHFLRGGDQVTGDTITRFYAVHAMFLPLLTSAVMLGHMVLIQVQGVSLPIGMSEREVRDRRPFFAEFLPTEMCLWLLLFGTIVTLAGLLPAEMGVKADPLKAAPAGIKPEWSFLFMFQTLKHVPESLGVLLFAAGGLFLFVLPLVDRKANRGKRSPGLTWLFVLLLAYALVFEVLALLAPGVASHPETETAQGIPLPGVLVSLGLLWAVIGFLTYALLQLVGINTRFRQLSAARATESVDVGMEH